MAGKRREELSWSMNHVRERVCQIRKRVEGLGVHTAALRVGDGSSDVKRSKVQRGVDKRFTSRSKLYPHVRHGPHTELYDLVYGHLKMPHTQSSLRT
eukprot:9692096-Heterocapsa_arctica.AAC.1